MWTRGFKQIVLTDEIKEIVGETDHISQVMGKR